MSDQPGPWVLDAPELSPDASAIWAEATSTSWGRDNGKAFMERIRAVPDPDERMRLCRMFMDRQHASFRALQQIVYESWRQTLPTDERPAAHADRYSKLVDRGDDFRALLTEVLDAGGSDVERAELLTVWVADGARWLSQLRSMRDTAIMNSLASGFTPKELGRRLRMSKTQIVNVRHRYLRDIESVGAATNDIVYRARDGIVLYINDALRRHTGLEPSAFIGRPTSELGHPEDYPRFLPQRDDAVRQGFGRFRGDLRLRTAGGGWRWFDADFRVVREPDTGAVEVHTEARPRQGDANCLTSNH